jgi:murein DD-endopeptidase MepM/ murein hydrolase activator NlpD
MPTVKHPARTTLGFLCTAGIALAAATPASASSRPTAADPAAISAAASAVKAASAAQATSTRSRTEAERAVADSTDLLDSAVHTLVAARAKLTQLSVLVDEAADERLGKRSGLLDVAAGVTDVAAEVAGVVAPVIEALDPLAEVVGGDASPEHRLTPVPGGAERELRLVRAAAIREQRAAAEEVSRAQRELDTAAGALAAARDAEQNASARMAAASHDAEVLTASLGIDNRLVRPGDGVVSSPYGTRVHPVTGSRRPHTGIDFQYGDGLAYAAARGTVVEVSRDPAYGNVVTIAHGQGISTRYAHLAAALVSPGDAVTPGQVVGKIGSTGLSTGPHLHFEILVNGRCQDPAGWLGG